MKKLFLVAALCLSTSAMAENWVALGLLTTQVKGSSAKVEFVQVGDFESRQACLAMVKSESMSSDYIEVGGTNGRLPQIQWNFDADCWLKRRD